MSRATIGLISFFGLALAAMIGMIVLGQSRLHHRGSLAVASATTIEGVSASPSTRRRTSPDGDMSDPQPGMGIPAGYRNSNARNFMRMRLRELTVAEEQYYQEKNTYTADLALLSTYLLKRTGDVVVVRVLSAGVAGWSAEATTPALPGKSCVVYAGPLSVQPKEPATMADHIKPLGERDMVCDNP